MNLSSLKAFFEHPTIQESTRLLREPINIDQCLKDFTKEEELGEDETWFVEHFTSILNSCFLVYFLLEEAPYIEQTTGISLQALCYSSSTRREGYGTYSMSSDTFQAAAKGLELTIICTRRGSINR